MRNGADLVLELPLPFVLSDSDRFAAAGVALAHATGLPCTMAFGSECGDTDALSRLAALPEAELESRTRAHLAAGLSYGAARQRALEELAPEDSKLLRNPNDLLGYGYLKAAIPLGLSYLAVRRETAHGGSPIGDIASGAYLRAHPEEIPHFCPEPLSGALDVAAAQNGLLTLLKSRSAAELAACANITEGLENRILSALNQVKTFDDLADAIKTKRYSHARLRRALIAGALELPAELPLLPPPYLRALAFNRRGAALLKKMRSAAAIPVVQTGREAETAAPAFFAVEKRATDLRNGWCLPPAPGGADYTRGAIII